MVSKKIICADALLWLQENKAASIITSPPDASEISMGLDEWAVWFNGACQLCFKSSGGPVVLYVTDRKHDKQTHSKPSIIFDAATKAGAKLIWHKIALRRGVGKTDIHRPGFSHLLAFNGAPKVATPDVFNRGDTLYANGTGLVAARVAVEWVLGQAEGVVDPFCGQGTIPAVAQAMGLAAIGVDIDRTQCEKAELCNLVMKG